MEGSVSNPQRVIWPAIDLTSMIAVLHMIEPGE